jgi:hypothetical protein
LAPGAERLTLRADLCRDTFGVGDYSFIVAVRSSYATVMALIGKPVVNRLAVPDVIQCPNPVHQSKRHCHINQLHRDLRLFVLVNPQVTCDVRG